MITIPQIRALGKLNSNIPTTADSINERPKTLDSLVSKGYAQRHDVNSYVLTSFGQDLLQKFTSSVFMTEV